MSAPFPWDKPASELTPDGPEHLNVWGYARELLISGKTIGEVASIIGAGYSTLSKRISEERAHDPTFLPIQRKPGPSPRAPHSVPASPAAPPAAGTAPAPPSGADNPMPSPVSACPPSPPIPTPTFASVSSGAFLLDGIAPEVIADFLADHGFSVGDLITYDRGYRAGMRSRIPSPSP